MNTGKTLFTNHRVPSTLPLGPRIRNSIELGAPTPDGKLHERRGLRRRQVATTASTPVRITPTLYKSRWQVELFFKWIKQHLRIKQFYGTSENAVKTQIWIAVSVYVLGHRQEAPRPGTPRSTLCYRSFRMPTT